MLLSALGFALMTTCVKLVATYGIPFLEIVAARALVSLIISYADVRRKGLSPWGTHRRLLFTRGLVGAFALFCVYYAVITLPLAEATLLQYTHPVFTALLALVVLRERLGASTMVCIALSIIGLVIMVEPGLVGGGGTDLPRLGVIVALAGALGSAVAYVIVRRLAALEDSSVIILYFPLVALPLSVVFLGDDFVMPGAEALVLLLLVGIFTQIGQTGLTLAMRHETAGKAAAYSYVQVIFAALFGWLVFAEVPALWTWVGGGLIILGALANLARR
ncbi:MAG: DMT family transporter [Halioglobus sp.]|nr:DMT family transporter [Halioglobus sp.]